MSDKYYFKIVSTSGPQPSLTTAPCYWHIRNPDNSESLFWPTNVKNNGSLQRDKRSKPGTASEGWEIFPCILKRSFIPTFQAAEKLAKELTLFSDTECSDIETKKNNKQYGAKFDSKFLFILNNTINIARFFKYRFPSHSKHIKICLNRPKPNPQKLH